MTNPENSKIGRTVNQLNLPESLKLPVAKSPILSLLQLQNEKKSHGISDIISSPTSEPTLVKEDSKAEKVKKFVSFADTKGLDLAQV